MKPFAPKAVSSKTRMSCFNLLEIVLAIGVIAIGLASVMVLFPVGSNAMRDAMATGYSANMADQMLHEFESHLRDDWTANYSDIPNSKPGTSEPSESDWSPWSTFNNIENDSTAPDNGFYRITAQTDIDGDDVEDFKAIMRLWRSQLVLSGSTIDWGTALKLNCEISWPAQRPYASREKEYFQLELFNRK